MSERSQLELHRVNRNSCRDTKRSAESFYRIILRALSFERIYAIDTFHSFFLIHPRGKARVHHGLWFLWGNAIAAELILPEIIVTPDRVHLSNNVTR